MRGLTGRVGLILALLTFMSGCAATTGAPAQSESVRVEEERFLMLGGIDQFVTIRGDDPANPVLLFIHGGPGDVQSPFVADYALYERDFTLIQWDQRGAGRTYGRHGEDTPNLTLDRLARDGIELAEYARERFGAPVLLLGHSWGSVIAAEMAVRRPDLFAAYVGTGQVGGWDRAVRYQYDLVRRDAESRGDAETLAALDALDPFDPKDVQDFLAVNARLRAMLGPADAAWLDGIVAHTQAAVAPEDQDAIGGGMTLSGITLFPAQTQEDLFSSAARLEVPVFVIQGREDLFTPTDVARDWFDQLDAPVKRFTVLEGAGHFALVTHAGAFRDALNAAAAEALQSGR